MSSLKYSIIKNRKQYDLYCNKLESLTEKSLKGKKDEIELLSYLIQKYNDEQTEMYQIKLDPVELLVELLSDNNISQAEFARRIDVSPQLVNDIIKYRREITKHIALKIGKEFNLKYYAFLKPYSLKKTG